MTVPEIKGSLSIWVEIEKGNLLANGVVNPVIKADVSDKMHLQVEVSLDDFADQCTDIWVILLSKLIKSQFEIESPQFMFQDFTLFGVQLLHDVEKNVRIAHGGPAVSLLCFLGQCPEIMALKDLADFTKINGTN